MFQNNPFKNLFAHFWQYSVGKRKYIFTFIFLSIIGNTFLLIQPIIVGRTFNSIQFSPNDPGLLSFVLKNLSLIFILTVLFWIFHGTSRIIEQKTAFFISKKYKEEMFRMVLNLPAEWHRDHHSGETIDKINKSSTSLFAFSSEIFFIIEMLIQVFGSFCMLLFFDKKAGIIGGIIFIIIIFIVLKFDRAIEKGYKRIFKKENFLASAIHDYITNIITIITLRFKNRAIKEIQRRGDLPYPYFKKNIILAEIKWGAVSICSSLAIALILIQNAYTSYKASGVILIGTLFTLYSYLDQASQAFFNFTWIYGETLRRSTAVKVALVIKEAYQKLSFRKKCFIPLRWKNIIIKNLNFIYQPTKAVDPSDFQEENSKKLADQKTANNKIPGKLQDINFSIQNGQRIALIGKSGSGKSTLLALLRGLYEPNQATVFIDKKKLPFGIKHLWNSTTLVPQEPEIFQNTILYNITLGVKTQKEVIKKIINITNLKQFIKKLPKGLETNVMEKGITLSGGEKQRLALARGLFALTDGERNFSSSNILLLDEPTSSVDTLNENQIFDNIFNQLAKNTIIVSIHRLHLLKKFDYIYFLEKGEIIAEGNLSQLLKNERFLQLWKALKTQ